MRTVLRLSIACAFMLLLINVKANAGDLETQIKAAYIYKFTAYVEWPASAYEQTTTPLVIGVINANDIAEALIHLRDTAPIQGRKLEVKLLKVGDTLNGIHILFISLHDQEKLKRLLDATQSLSVLTVTDSLGALRAGSVINFVTIDDRVRFEISLYQAERRGLKISARLLTVAQKVESLKP